MDFKTTNTGDATEVRMMGRLEFTDHDKLQDLVTLLGQTSRRRFAIDLSALEFVDSAGLGMLLIRGLNQHDYPVIQACLLMLSIAVMLGTLVGDLAQAAMDPRVRSALQ